MTSSYPASVELALSSRHVPVVFTADDSLEEAQVSYLSLLALWRSRNGKDGGMVAFDLLVTAARRLRALEECGSAGREETGGG